jgi:hypothetical protein
MNKEFYSIVSPCSDMLINNNNYGNYNNDVSNDDKMKNNKKRKINTIFMLFVTFFAMYLAYDCNKCESMGMRIFYTLVAGIFSGLYLLYYLIVRVFLGNKCKKGFGDAVYSLTSNDSYELFKRR